MSFVLEALRKSEQERQMAAGASAGVLHPVLVEEPAFSWRWMIVAALVVAAAVLAWTFWPRPPLARPVQQAPATGNRAAAPPAATATVPAADEAARSTIGKTAGGPVTAPAAIRHKPAGSASPAAGSQSAVEAGDLPAAMLAELPPLLIAGFIHDEQGGSMAMIDDKLLREGDEVAPGLRLEKILGDGALFSYKGFRFRR